MMEQLKFNKQSANYMKLKKIIPPLLFLGFIIVGPGLTHAQSLVDTTDPAYATGGYTLDHIRNYLIYLMYFILGLVGTLSLAAFVYGGIVFLTSTGSDQKVKKGKDILGAAVIGLLIVFSSVLIIQTLFNGLGIKWDATKGTLPDIK